MRGLVAFGHITATLILVGPIAGDAHMDHLGMNDNQVVMVIEHTNERDLVVSKVI